MTRRSPRRLVPGILVTAALVAATAPMIHAAPPGSIWDPRSIAEVYDPAGDLYSYAPSVIVDSSEEHIFSCHNDEAGVIRDRIYYTHRVDGDVVSSEPVFGPGPEGAWDSFHVCDPSVVEGDFHYNGTDYRYAMFYLGNDVDASANNQVGVAFADAFDDTWVRYPEPIGEYPSDVLGQWGSGQPSAVSIDKGGRVLLFYTQGTQATGTRVVRREVDLADMSRPVVGPVVVQSRAGLTDRNGNLDWFNQADFVFDPVKDQFFVVREQHPYPADHPAFVGASVQVASMPAADVWRGTGTWRVEGDIDAELTGYPRNHNAGLARDSFGHLPVDPENPRHGNTPTSLRVIFTTSCSASTHEYCERFPTALWRNALWEITGKSLPGGR